jgi:hypothetical protein
MSTRLRRVTYRAGCPEFLGEGPSVRHGGKSAWGTTTVRERLYVDSVGTMIVHDGILSRGQAEHGTQCD